MELSRNKLDMWYSNKHPQYNISESGYCNYSFSIKYINTKSLFSYGESYGTERLRDCISKRYACELDNILITNGTSEGLYILLNSLLNQGDELIVCEPYFVDTNVLIQHLSIKQIRIQMDIMQEFDINTIYQAVTDNTKCIVINFPNNPLGISITEAQQKELYQYAKEKKIYIISDDVFKEIYPANLPILFGEYWISLNGVSKSFGYPGLRLGWILADKIIINKALCMKEIVNVATNAVSQKLVCDLLKSGEHILHKNNINIQKNLYYIKTTLSKYNLFNISNYHGGCCLILTYNTVNSISSTQLCSDLLRETGILVVPGDCFGITNGIRIGFGMSHWRFKKIFNKFILYCNRVLI